MSKVGPAVSLLNSEQKKVFEKRKAWADLLAGRRTLAMAVASKSGPPWTAASPRGTINSSKSTRICQVVELIFTTFCH